LSSVDIQVAGALVIRGRFRLVRLLGEGGMGVIWEALEVATGRSRAIKFIKPEAHSPMMERRLLREAEALRAVVHPGIVAVDEVVASDDGTPAMVMELLRGESLDARIERQGALGPGQTSAILARVVDAVTAAHNAGVLHRDLKPDNIFLAVSPEGRVTVRVVDFGVAKLEIGGDSLTVTGSIVGTPLYMSPEQAAGERGLDARTDLWSLAVIAFECLTGTTPTTGDNYGQILAKLIKLEIQTLSQLRPDLPPELVAAIDGALLPRDRRAQGLAALGHVFARHADREIEPPPADALPAGNVAPPTDDVATLLTVPPPPRNAPLVAILAVALTVLVVGGGVGTLMIRGRHASARAKLAASAASAASAETGAIAAASPDAGASSVAVTSPEPSTSAAVAEVAPSSAVAPGSAASAPGLAPTGAVSAGASSAKRPRDPGGKGEPRRLQGGVARDVPF